MPTNYQPIQHVMPGDLVIWDHAFCKSQDTGGFPYGHVGLVYGTFQSYFNPANELITEPAIAIIDALSAGKTKKTHTNLPQKNLAIRIYPIRFFLEQHGRKITFYSNNYLRSMPFVPTQIQIPFVNFVEFPDEIRTLEARETTYHSYNYDSSALQQRLILTALNIIGIRANPVYYQPRIMQLLTSSSSWGPKAEARLLKYSRRFHQSSVTQTEQSHHQPVIDHVLCAEFIILCYQLAFQNHAPSRTTPATRGNDFGIFIELDARASGPWNLAKYLNMQTQTWTKYALQRTVTSMAPTLQNTLSADPESDVDENLNSSADRPTIGSSGSESILVHHVPAAAKKPHRSLSQPPCRNSQFDAEDMQVIAACGNTAHMYNYAPSNNALRKNKTPQ